MTIGATTPRLVCRPAGIIRSRVFAPHRRARRRPRRRALSFDRQPGHKIYVNGRLVGQYKAIAATPPLLKKYADLGKYFHKGRNCIAIEAETYSWWGPVKSLFLEGAGHADHGQIVRILTDTRWKAAYQPAAGWTDPEFDDSAWRHVVSQGKPAAGYGPLNDASISIRPIYGPIHLRPPPGTLFFMMRANRWRFP